MRKVFMSLAFALLITVKAQSVYVGGLFPTIDQSAEITNKLSYDFYYFVAAPLINSNKPNFKKDANFLLFYSEQSLSYKVSDKFSLTGSYVYQRTNAVYDNYVNENRIYIQGKYKQSIKKLNFTHRLRFDARFIQNRITHLAPLTHRVRYLLGLDFPIQTKKNNLYITIYEEAFFSTTLNASPIYSENWAYTALGIKLNKKNKIETGVLYIRWNTGRNDWFNQYYFQVTWINHLDFRKKKE